MQCTDPVCFFVKGHNKPFYQNKVDGRDVKHDCYIKAHPEKDNTGHPAQKPLEIIEGGQAFFILTTFRFKYKRTVIRVGFKKIHIVV